MATGLTTSVRLHREKNRRKSREPPSSELNFSATLRETRFFKLKKKKVCVWVHHIFLWMQGQALPSLLCPPDSDSPGTGRPGNMDRKES